MIDITDLLIEINKKLNRIEFYKNFIEKGEDNDRKDIE